MFELRLIEYFMMFVVLFYMLSVLFIFVKYRSRLRTQSDSKNLWEPTVSIVIPAYNEGNLIASCINSLLKVNYPRNKLEILVVDDGSKDNTVEVVRSFKDKRVKLLTKENEGNAAYTKNYGIRRAVGEVIITLDADSWVTPNSIKNILRYFDDDVAAVTAAVKVDKKCSKNFIGKLQDVEYLFTVFNRRLFSFINGVWVTPGPLSAFRRKVFDKVGLFDPKNIMEDQEMALRIQAANYRIASCTDAVVYTAVPQTLKALYSQRLRWNRGGMKNVWEYRYLVKPQYGDFGMFIMPISILSIALVISVLASAGLSLTKALAPPVSNDIMLSIEPIHIFSGIVFILTGAWTFLSLKEMKRKVAFPIVIAYMIIYSYMISFFTVIALFKELRGEALVW
jgi:cellulose synthase/poly-beta-1,6-N-acetylglucosamine synthase-like glycosyltransferase